MKEILVIVEEKNEIFQQYVVKCLYMLMKLVECAPTRNQHVEMHILLIFLFNNDEALFHLNQELLLT